MEIITFRVPEITSEVVIAPLGDFQWSGKKGSTALTHLQDHIARSLDKGAYFFGTGDYTDFLSPSNRQRLRAAALYDTAEEVIDAKAMELVHEIYELALKPTVGRWIGLLEGHHFTELKDGTTTDARLAEMLKAPFLGTSALVRIGFDSSERSIAKRSAAEHGEAKLSRAQHSMVFWAHHGTGGGALPAAPLNKLYHVYAGWEGVDVYMMGHTTKDSTTRLSRPYPNWLKHDLIHRDVFLVNTGGFSKSNIVRHKSGRSPRGDYAEQRMLTPSPLAAPLIYLWPRKGTKQADVRVLL